MTDSKEIAQLARLMQATGATVTIVHDAGGHIDSVQVQTVHCPGMVAIGPHPMAPIAAAEAMRAYLVGSPV